MCSFGAETLPKDWENMQTILYSLYDAFRSSEGLHGRTIVKVLRDLQPNIALMVKDEMV